MSLESKIRTELAKYLAGELAIDGLTEWFVRTTWDEEESVYTGPLVRKIELAFAEFTNDHLTEDELQARFRPFLEKQSYIFAGTKAVMVSSSSSSISEYSSAK